LVSLTTRLDRPGYRRAEAELVSYLHAIDDSLESAMEPSAPRALLLDTLPAIAGIRAAGTGLKSNGLVTVADVFAESVRLVLEHETVPLEEAYAHLRGIADALRAYVAALADGADTRPLLTLTWAGFQALQELRAAAARTLPVVVANESHAGSEHSGETRSRHQPAGECASGENFRAECDHHLNLIRSAAEDLRHDPLKQAPVHAALRSLQSLKSSARVAEIFEVSESCRRSEERIRRIAADPRTRRLSLAAEVRLAADSVEELIEHTDGAGHGSRRLGPYPMSRHASRSNGARVERAPDAGTLARAMLDAGRTTRTLWELIEASVRLGRDVADSALADDSYAQLTPALDETMSALSNLGRLLDERVVIAEQRSPRETTFGALSLRAQSAFDAMTRAADKTVDLDVEGAGIHLTPDLAEDLVEPILELLGNAIEHGIEPASVRESAGKDARGAVILRAFGQGDQFGIEVFDDGAGIDVQEVARRAGQIGITDAADGPNGDVGLALVFTSGYTMTDPMKDTGPRGYGLDVVREMVERRGGQATVVSTPGVGTCFRIIVPASETAGRDTQLPRPNGAVPVEAGNDLLRTVLVVDDSVGVRRVLGRTLQRHGWQTVQARDGAEALRVLDAGLPDLLVTDVEMPGVDGFELVRTIRSRAGGAHLPIVVLTSRGSEGHQQQLLALGADACLVKPFDEPDLLTALANAAERRRPVVDAG